MYNLDSEVILNLWINDDRNYNLKEKNVFVVGDYHGSQTPAIFADFRKPHVDELKEIMERYVFEGQSDSTFVMYQQGQRTQEQNVIMLDDVP